MLANRFGPDMELRRPDGTLMYRQRGDLPLGGWPSGIVGPVEEWHDGKLFARGEGDGTIIHWRFER